MTGPDMLLLGAAFAAIGMLVVLVTLWKVNPFIALALASLVVGGSAVALGVKIAPAPGGDLRAMTMPDVVEAFQSGLGKTLGNIAAVLALGTILGKFLAESGGAEVLAQRFTRLFGPQRVVLCIIALALAVGLATWFAVGVVLLLPILLTLTRESRRPFLLLALPLISFLMVMHGLMPPHPGPVVAIARLNASMGQVLLWGFVIGLPIATLGGPVFARFAVRHVAVVAPLAVTQDHSGRKQPPGFGLTLLSILLPVLLMLVGTAVELLGAQATALGKAGLFIGNPTIALLLSVLFASWSLGSRCGFTAAQLLRFTEAGIATIGLTLLVVGGGGGFARVLTDCGVARSLGELAKGAHLSPIFYGWLVAAFIRIATGSATVSITVAAGLLVPVAAEHPEVNVELLIIAMGCGSSVLSHLNDGGFWIVRDSLGLTVGQTLRTWTVLTTIIGLSGLALTLAAQALWAMLPP